MSATRHSPHAAKWVDCAQHGPGSGAELLLVEGDSALSSVVAVRNPQTQAVLAFQGKPLNAWQAPEARVAQHAHYRLLAQALGLPAATGVAELSGQPLRFERVCLLFDPDADGIHIGALVVLYLHRWLPGLVASGRLCLLRAPMFELAAADTGELHYAEHPGQCQALSAHLRHAAGGQPPRVQVMRGLGSVASAVLRQRCVDPATRRVQAMGPDEVASVVAVFGGGPLNPPAPPPRP